MPIKPMMKNPTISIAVIWLAVLTAAGCTGVMKTAESPEPAPGALEAAQEEIERIREEALAGGRPRDRLDELEEIRVSPDPMEDGTMETSVPDWEPDRSGIRFVQFPAPGADGRGAAGKPAVWLEADGMSAHLEQGRAVRFHGREIRLASLRPLADGRVLITLDVDGAPHPITW